MSRNVRNVPSSYAYNEDSDQTAHSRNLIESSVCAFWIPKDAKFFPADAQADSSLRWWHMSEGTGSHVAA